MLPHYLHNKFHVLVIGDATPNWVKLDPFSGYVVIIRLQHSYCAVRGMKRQTGLYWMQMKKSCVLPLSSDQTADGPGFDSFILVPCYWSIAPSWADETVFHNLPKPIALRLLSIKKSTVCVGKELTGMTKKAKELSMILPRCDRKEIHQSSRLI